MSNMLTVIMMILTKSEALFPAIPTFRVNGKGLKIEPNLLLK